MPVAINASKLRERLNRETRCDLRFDRPGRMLYSTDASLYQIEPIGVAVPKTIDDVIRAVRIAAELNVPIVPRGSATSLSGQTIGEALILDFSRHINRIGVVDRDKMTVRVEPGLVLDHFNDHLKPLGLMFAPDVSTSNRATLGGMMGNNSAGARSLRYGKTIDHVRSIDVVLADGTATTFGPLDPDRLAAICDRDDTIGRVHRTVRDVVAKHKDAIIAKYPRILRRVSGYNLDEFVPGLPVRAEGWVDDPWKFNLAKLIVGSEGTLSVVTGAEVRVVELPKAQGLVVFSFSNTIEAFERVGEMLESKPVSLEMLDRLILELAAANSEYAKYLTFTEGRPEAVLAAQFYCDSADELAERCEKLARRFEGRPGVLAVRQCLTQKARDDFWKVRKGGLAILMGMLGDAKPVAFVEDTAVSVERLPEFYRRFQQILDRHGVPAACYGHADVGCLHIRPILNMKTQEHVDAVRTIARDVSDLVIEFGGSMSGEHGDGLARSVWNPKLFGPEVYSAFEEVKRAFDPENRLNPGKVVAQPDPAANLRYGVSYHAQEPASTVLDFSNQGGFAAAVEMCSGVGECRKTTSGTMCPSYMITRDEEHSTRGRANALRLVMSGAVPSEGLANDALYQTLDLCLECKACKTECPSNVDVAKLKAEFLYQYYLSNPMPIGYRLMGRIATVNRISAAIAPLANRAGGLAITRYLLEKIAGIDRRRIMPTFEFNHLRRWFKKHKVDPKAGTRGVVLLLDDCFTTYNNPSVGKAAVRVLERAGYRVELAGLECCGRAAISKGLAPYARDLARRNVAKLIGRVREGVPIVGCEPSCLLTIADEYKDFRIGPDAIAVAGATILVDDFVADRGRVPELDLAPRAGKAILHGHCQQKALVGMAGSIAALKRIEGLEVEALDSGCCGMAGSFGYELGHYELSVALANRVLLPAIAKRPDAVVAAPGFSCRSQIKGLSTAKPLHPIEILAEQLP
jgi:FAD/FMN-containing dehydrogenase/Fe-S oxidoreductase